MPQTDIALDTVLDEATKKPVIHWLEHTGRTILSQFPQTTLYSHRLVASLSSLLLDRLPSEISMMILELLPKEIENSIYAQLKTSATSDPDSSIGYIHFVEKTNLLLGIGLNQESDQELGHRSNKEKNLENENYELSKKLTDSFLWAIAQEFPPDLKYKIRDQLPSELKHRMNLYSSNAEESKVA